MTTQQDINLDDFHFDLPPSLVAQMPTDNRTDSRLLVYNRQTQIHQHNHFFDISDHLRDGDLLVMNNTRVMAARLFGQKTSGGKLELLIERVLGDKHFVAQIKASKSLKPGSFFCIGDNINIQVTGRRESMFVCQIESEPTVFDLIKTHGHIPLPPYIERSATETDVERYQTVFSKHEGAVAAPTAGLHFDEALLERLEQKGVKQDYLTLHVGAGTFQPVRESNISLHKMHSEWLMVSDSLVDNIKATKANGGRVIAVGTTVVRALETAALSGELACFEGDSNIFLYPGKPFHVIDGMVTNFHLPGSSLLMLVAAFIGTDEVKALYREAIEKQYRFFSYGDSSLLL
tara:strand:- start:570 stop:1607 length:1038 start_codon:yes stop_codon:yes gene_type:complete